MYTDDPIADFYDYDAENARRLERRPVCNICGEHIQDEHLYQIGGELVCESCLNDNYRKSTDSFIEEDLR